MDLHWCCHLPVLSMLKNAFSQDEHGWTLINPDEAFFDRLDDREYQLVNIQPFGQYLAPRRPYELSVSFIADLSQWRKQFNWASVFVITSASIIVTMLFFNCLKAYFSQDERWWTPINPDVISFDRLDDRAYQPVNLQPLRCSPACYSPAGAERGWLRWLITKPATSLHYHHYICVHLCSSMLQLPLSIVKMHLFHRMNTDERR